MRDAEQQRDEHDEREPDPVEREQLWDRVDVEHRASASMRSMPSSTAITTTPSRPTSDDRDEQPADALVIGRGQPISRPTTCERWATL